MGHSCLMRGNFVDINIHNLATKVQHCDLRIFSEISLKKPDRLPQIDNNGIIEVNNIVNIIADNLYAAMSTKTKRGKIKKRSKSKSLDDLSINYSENTASAILVKRMASNTLSSGSRGIKKRSQNTDEWGMTSKTSHSTPSSPWLSKKRFYIEALLDPEDKSFGRFMSGEISDGVFEHLTLEEVKDLKLVFDAFDTDCSGSIDISELERVMNALGFKTSKESVKKMIGSLDDDDSGKIEFNEFLEFVISKQGNDRDIHSELMKGFRLIDSDSTGKISLENLRSACRENGVQLSDQELREMIEEADKDGDSEVNQSEFIEIMLKTNLF